MGSESSVQTHTIEEGKCAAFSITKEPSVVLLEYTFRTNSVCRENSIQTGFGGVGLMSTVEDLHPGITNDCDDVTVEFHDRSIICRAIDNLSVILFPILASSDGGVHLLFDLTHGLRSD